MFDSRRWLSGIFGDDNLKLPYFILVILAFSVGAPVFAENYNQKDEQSGVKP